MAGGTVRITKGEGTLYKNPDNTLNSCLVLDTNQKLIGTGRDSTKITLADNQNVHIVTSASFEDSADAYDLGVELSSMTIDGNKTNNTSGCILNPRTFRGLFKHLSLNNAADIGVQLSGGSGDNKASENIFFDMDTRMSANSNLLIASYSYDNYFDMCNFWKSISTNNVVIRSGGQIFLVCRMESDGTNGGWGVRCNSIELHLLGCKVGGNPDGGVLFTNQSADENLRDSSIIGGTINENGSYGVLFDGHFTSYTITNHIIQGVNIFGHNTAGEYGVKEYGSGNEDYNTIDANFRDNDTDVSLSGSNSIAFSGGDYVNHNYGSSSITSGTTSKQVAHGLSSTPTHVNMSRKENATNDTGDWWWTADGTNITFNVENDPGASNLDFSWEARF